MLAQPLLPLPKAHTMNLHDGLILYDYPRALPVGRRPRLPALLERRLRLRNDDRIHPVEEAIYEVKPRREPPSNRGLEEANSNSNPSSRLSKIDLDLFRVVVVTGVLTVLRKPNLLPKGLPGIESDRSDIGTAACVRVLRTVDSACKAVNSERKSRFDNRLKGAIFSLLLSS